MLNLYNTLSVPCIPCFADIHIFIRYKLLKCFIYFHRNNILIFYSPSLIGCCTVSQPHGGAIAQQFCPSTFELSVKLVLYADNIKAIFNFFPCFGFLFHLFYARF